LDSQFQSLRSELQKAEAKLRQRDEELRRAQKRVPEKAAVPIIVGEPTPDELARLNRQLENRNVELQARLEELTADAEARAVSVGAVTDQPVEDPNAQLRTLLALKMQEDFDDFIALEKESPDIVVQQHYRTVLRHVFEILKQEGVRFNELASSS
jgi:7-keto-8-aminopelargonate synthetase-like enzyme